MWHPLVLMNHVAILSAIDTSDEPMTLDNCRATPSSVDPRASIPVTVTAASRSASVKNRSSSSTSGKPRARQKRFSSSRGTAVSEASSGPV